MENLLNYSPSLSFNKKELMLLYLLTGNNVNYDTISNKIFTLLVRYYKDQLDKRDLLILTKVGDSTDNKNYAFNILEKKSSLLKKEDWENLSRHGGTLYIKKRAYEEIIRLFH
jgi:hypothetical protein